MDILGMFSGFAADQIAGLAVGLAGGAVLYALYKAFNVAKYINGGASGLGAYAGQRMAVYVKRIKDAQLREKISNDIKNAPDEFNAAFDSAFDIELLK